MQSLYYWKGKIVVQTLELLSFLFQGTMVSIVESLSHRDLLEGKPTHFHAARDKCTGNRMQMPGH